MRRWWWPTLALAALIWWLSSRSTPLGLPLTHPFDYLLHFASYAALAFCVGRASGSFALAWVLVAWLGAIDEVHQAYVPGREAGITDWWFDFFGAALGSALATRGLRARGRRHRAVE